MARDLDRREFLATGAAAAAYALSGSAFAQAADPTTLGIAAAHRLMRSGALSPTGAGGGLPRAHPAASTLA